MAYKYHAGSDLGLLFGSQIEPRRLTLMAAGTPDRKFADRFLNQFRGVSQQSLRILSTSSARLIHELVLGIEF